MWITHFLQKIFLYVVKKWINTFVRLCSLFKPLSLIDKRFKISKVLYLNEITTIKKKRKKKKLCKLLLLRNLWKAHFRFLQGKSYFMNHEFHLLTKTHKKPLLLMMFVVNMAWIMSEKENVFLMFFELIHFES